MSSNPSTFARAKHCTCKWLPPMLLALLASACVQQQPLGPTLTALPGPGWSQQEFQSADMTCRSNAQSHTEAPGATPASWYNVQPPVITAQQLYNVVYGQCMAARGSIVNSDLIAQVPFYPYAYPGYSSYRGMAQGMGR